MLVYNLSRDITYQVDIPMEQLAESLTCKCLLEESYYMPTRKERIIPTSTVSYLILFSFLW
jgi:hypothetical protein